MITRTLTGQEAELQGIEPDDIEMAYRRGYGVLQYGRCAVIHLRDSCGTICGNGGPQCQIAKPSNELRRMLHPPHAPCF